MSSILNDPSDEWSVSTPSDSKIDRHAARFLNNDLSKSTVSIIATDYSTRIFSRLEEQARTPI
jgi:hypothetical protein